MEIPVAIDTICVPSDDVVARKIEDDIIIIPLTSGIGDGDEVLYTLNETGQAIWEELDGLRTLGEIAAVLTRKFPSPSEEITSDVLGFASEMTRRGFLTVKG